MIKFFLGYLCGILSTAGFMVYVFRSMTRDIWDPIPKYRGNILHPARWGEIKKD